MDEERVGGRKGGKEKGRKGEKEKGRKGEAREGGVCVTQILQLQRESGPFSIT